MLCVWRKERGLECSATGRLMGLLASIALCGTVLSHEPLFEAASQAEKRPWTSTEFNDGPQSFHFAIVADRTGGERAGVFGAAIEKINLLQPAFVMSVGDLVEGYTDSEKEIKRQWAEFDSIIGRLEMPFFYVAGNHDIRDKETEKYWRKRFGSPYYHFLYKGTLFICLSTTYDGDTATLNNKQASYAADILRQYPNPRWTFVFMHHPLWLYSSERGWDRIEAMLKARRFTVFAGHLHRFVRSRGDEGGRYVIATTGGGFPREGARESLFDNIIWVTVPDSGAPRIASLLPEGIRNIDSVGIAADSTVIEDAGR